MLLSPLGRNGSSNRSTHFFMAIFTKLCQRKFILIVAVVVLCVCIYDMFTVFGNHAAYDSKGSISFMKDSILKGLRLSYQDSFKWDGKVGDKVIVMAHTYQEDVSWVEEHLPE